MFKGIIFTMSSVGAINISTNKYHIISFFDYFLSGFCLGLVKSSEILNNLHLVSFCKSNGSLQLKVLPISPWFELNNMCFSVTP